MGHDGDLAAPGGAVGAEDGHAHEAAADDAQAGMSPGERRLLAVMPLHAITTIYGEAGLRERLAIEAEAFADAGPDRIATALDLAARLHAGDRRQREPYLCHPLRVAIRVISGYRVRDADVVCAALLHDAVEDHAADLAPGGSQHDAVGALAAQFGDRVASLAASVTNAPHLPGGDRDARYREHVAASLQANPWARVLKASDFTDNGVGLIYTTGPTRDRLAAKYAPLVPVLRDVVARPDTPLSGDVKRHILEQLGRASERFAVLCSGDPGPAVTVWSTAPQAGAPGTVMAIWAPARNQAQGLLVAGLCHQARHPTAGRCQAAAVPGGGFVVELAALEAGVEDADPAVGELPQCLAVGLAAAAELVVVAACGRPGSGG